MLRQIRLCWFQLKQYLKVGYFVQLLILSTTIPVIVQILAFESADVLLDTVWIRAGVIGMWSTAITAAGILGFERMKGTLPYLAHATIHPVRALSAPITSCSLCGVCAFPIAYSEVALGSLVIGKSLPICSEPALCLVGVAALWFACWVMSMLIAWLFLITPHALAYEGLLSVPILLGSGIFSNAPLQGLARLAYLIPLRIPVEMLYFPAQMSALKILLFVIVMLVWAVVVWLAARLALRRIRVTGTLEVM